jgi:hypothetical protein
MKVQLISIFFLVEGSAIMNASGLVADKREFMEMAGKKKRKKQPTLRSRIVGLIMERGPVKLGIMVKTLDAPYQSLNTEALELRRLGILQKDAEGVWSLVPGTDPTMYGVEIIKPYSIGSAGPQLESSRTLQDEFRDLLRSTGVKKGVEAITDIYFSGDDIWNAQWLYKVLADYSEGFLTEDQCKLIMASWTITKGIPYEYEDFFKD